MFRHVTLFSRNLTSFRTHYVQTLGTSAQVLCSTASRPNASRNNTDFADVMDVESSLFNNSRQSKAVDSRKLLEQYSSKPKNRRRDGTKRFHNAKPQKHQQQEETHQPATSAQPKSKAPRVKSEVVHNTTLGLTYTKLHLNDPWLNTLLLSVKSRKSRSLKHQLLVEGRRLIVEAIQAGLVLDHILFSDHEQLQLIKPHLPDNAQLVKVPQSDLRLWSSLSTCPGLMAVFTKPTDMSTIWQSRPQRDTLPITVVCDQIREPNNVGSIIRNCAAIAVQQVIVTKGCADPWESKALRGGAGAQFKVPVRGPCDWSSIRSMLPTGNDDCFVYVADNNPTNVRAHIPARDDLLADYSSVSYAGKHCVLVIGGETEGISAEAYTLLRRNVLGKCVHIPLAPDVDSLNTASALAVILFEMKKQMLAATGQRL